MDPSSHTGFDRPGSSNYWGADAWDPDQRVYAGALDGQVAAVGCVHSVFQTPRSSNFWDAMGGGAGDEGPAIDVLPQQPSDDRWRTAVAGCSPVEANVLQCKVQRQESNSYWDQGNWVDLTGAPTMARQAQIRHLDSPPRSMKVAEPTSNAYWDAGQWDPDERVYVGAELGAANHLLAVDMDKNEVAGIGSMLSQAWQGGLVCKALGLGAAIGGPVDLGMCDLEAKPTMKEHYEMFEESVGFGSFGIVRRARHVPSDRACCVKAIKKASAGDLYRANLIEGGLGEALLRMSRDQRCPNIAEYLDMLEGPSYFYVVMEELSGPELLKNIEERFPVTEWFLETVMSQILNSLVHLHDVVHLYHRDVKLANYRFRGSPDSSPLVLLDFGFASSVDRPWDGAVCGTTMFMAPELVKRTCEVPHLAAVDMWAAGVILYVLLTGDAPFQDDEIKRVAKSETDDKVLEILQGVLSTKDVMAASSLPRDLLHKLLTVDPKARWTAAQALQHEWFSQKDMGIVVSVPPEKYRKVRAESVWSKPRSGER